MEAQQTSPNGSTELNEFAGRLVWKGITADTQEVQTLADVSEGDRVAMAAGEGMQGIVTEVKTEGGTGMDPHDGHGLQKVRVKTHTGGERTHILHGDADHYSDDAARFGLPGYTGGPGDRHRVHKLVIIE